MFQMYVLKSDSECSTQISLTTTMAMLTVVFTTVIIAIIAILVSSSQFSYEIFALPEILRSRDVVRKGG